MSSVQLSDSYKTIKLSVNGRWVISCQINQYLGNQKFVVSEIYQFFLIHSPGTHLEHIFQKKISNPIKWWL